MAGYLDVCLLQLRVPVLPLHHLNLRVALSVHCLTLYSFFNFLFSSPNVGSWFPGMNIEIENIVQSCFSCQIATNTVDTEPVKMTELQQQPWERVELDFCRPFPNGEYAMVLADQYSRYPEVELLRICFKLIEVHHILQ